MNRVLIHYFSGTGNAAHAAKLMLDNLEKKGYQVKQQLVEKGILPPAEDFDFHIFVFSTLSFSAPVMMKRYIRKLKKGSNTKAMVFAVFGGHPMQAIVQVERMLRRRKYDVFLTGGAEYPNNWIQVTNLQTPEEAGRIIADGDKKVEEYTAKFMAQKSEFFPCSSFSAVWSWIIAALFGLMGRRFFGKLYVTDKNCNLCGICVKTCPARAIKLRGHIHKKPYWNFSCENCSRCINICPKKAIQVSTLKFLLHTMVYIFLIILLVILLINVNRFLTIQLIPSLSIIAELLAVVFFVAALIWVEFFLLDWFFFFLEQLPGIGRIFEASYTKNFRRYIAPGFNPLKK